MGSNPAQCASWCFVFAVFLIFSGGFAVVLGCTRTANLPNAPRSSLVLLGSTPGTLFFCCWFLRVSLFVSVLGLGFKSRPVRFVVFCVCGVFAFFSGGFAVVLGCTRTANRPNALRSSLVVLGSTPGSLFLCSCSCLVSACFSFCFGLGSWVQIPSSALRGVLCLWCF